MTFSKTGTKVYGKNSKDIAVKAEQTVADFKEHGIDMHFHVKPCSIPGTPFFAEFFIINN